MKADAYARKLLALVWAAYEVGRAMRALKRQALSDWLASIGAEPVPLQLWSEAAQQCEWHATLHGAVERVGRLLPEQGRCLIKSRALVSMRCRAGLASVMLIGFRTDETGRLAGHAWLAYRRECPQRVAGGREATQHQVTAAYRVRSSP